MKPETLVMKIIEAIETASPTVITFNGKKISITKKLIDKYKYCKVRDDIDLERIDANAKTGGFLPLLPLIFAGITAAGVATGGISAAVSSANEKKAAAAKAAATKAANEKKAAEERRHNLKMEKLAEGKKGSGVGEMIGKIKEFGKIFGEETKKTMKNVNDLDLSNIDSKRKNLILFDDCVAQRNQVVQQEFFTKGRHHNCHCIYQSQSFYGMDSMFIRKNANCFLLFEFNDKDLSQIIINR
ncbi:hypothetical protein LOTGIDRAFT_171394 [Lottia gigantea]|uniref:Uncharacterized protein n=1 Tax=Lottia gigantea TaxID=225164 RepID=V4CMB0_LOTGI|nr:hypothetical protein LOTGIDRAFT_171394 [Lottia gigantea]ESP03455.1 hypothetical protein LOTGIDRAFT_171394 [Lottia gigantea]